MTSYKLSVPAVYKRHLKDHHLSYYVAMPAGKRRMQPDGGGGDVATAPKRVMAPELDTCKSINSAFDPNRVLLRRVFFIGPEKTKYISIGFYPTRKYQPLVVIGVPRKTR